MKTVVPMIGVGVGVTLGLLLDQALGLLLLDLALGVSFHVLLRLRGGNRRAAHRLALPAVPPFHFNGGAHVFHPDVLLRELGADAIVHSADCQASPAGLRERSDLPRELGVDPPTDLLGCRPAWFFLVGFAVTIYNTNLAVCLLHEPGGPVRACAALLYDVRELPDLHHASLAGTGLMIYWEVVLSWVFLLSLVVAIYVVNLVAQPFCLNLVGQISLMSLVAQSLAILSLEVPRAWSCSSSTGAWSCRPARVSF